MNRFIDWFTELIEPIREYVISNHNNPIFWIVVFALAIVISKFVYSELSRGK